MSGKSRRKSKGQGISLFNISLVEKETSQPPPPETPVVRSVFVYTYRNKLYIGHSLEHTFASNVERLGAVVFLPDGGILPLTAEDYGSADTGSGTFSNYSDFDDNGDEGVGV